MSFLRPFRLLPVPVLAIVMLASLGTAHALAADPCAAPVTNQVACENTKPGDPPSDWQVNGIGESSIQGYATPMSVNVGQTENFKIKTPASSYHIDILRLGYYGGDGARLIAVEHQAFGDASRKPSRTARPAAPPAWSNAAIGGLGLLGGPSNAVSGLYIAHLVRNDTGGESQIFFVVRDDSSHSDVVLKTSDTTWQAYNAYGGNSLYSCTVSCPPGKPGGYKAAYAVSYNRPFDGTLDHRQRAFGPLLRRVPDDPLPRAKRLRPHLRRPEGRRLAPGAAAKPQGLHLQRPRRVLVGRRTPERRSGPRPASTSRFSAATSCSGRPAGVEQLRRLEHRYRTLVDYKDTHFASRSIPSLRA